MYYLRRLFLSVVDEFEQDLKAIFGEKVKDMNPRVKNLLSELWAVAHRRGRRDIEIAAPRSRKERLITGMDLSTAYLEEEAKKFAKLTKAELIEKACEALQVEASGIGGGDGSAFKG